jgi:uncharacterized protein (DUF2252 family)
MGKSAKIVSPDSRRIALRDWRYGKMARSAHAFVRGNLEPFYDWLSGPRAPTIPSGPPIWICGDCHLGNLGPVADDAGHVSIQIRDFDQSTVGNPSFDLCRLALSLAVLVRSSDLPGITTSLMLECLLAGYEAALDDHSDDHPELPPLLRVEVRKADRRSRKALARERTRSETLRLPLGKDFWPVTPREQRALNSLFEHPSMIELATQLKHREQGAHVKVLDAAYWRKGCSSLGHLRYAVLLDIDGAASEGDDFCLMDIKEAVPSVALAAPGVTIASDPGERVVAAARHLAPALGERMRADHLLGKSVFVRELLPQDIKLDVGHIRPKQTRRLATYLGHVVGRAHASQMDRSTRVAWARELHCSRTRTMNAPSWLWQCTVGLLADQEEAYLHHCHQYLAKCRSA